MQSKTSFFNATLFKKNLSRIWLLGLAYFLLMLLVMPVSYGLNYTNYLKFNGTFDLQMADQYFLDSVTLLLDGMLPCLTAIVAVLLVFGYLYNQRASYTIHSLPVSRVALYVTGMLSAFVTLIVPHALITIIMLIQGAAYKVSGDVLITILFWFWCKLSYTVLFLGMAGFIAMLSGQSVAVALFYFIFNFLYSAMQYVIGLFMETVGFGLYNVTNDIVMSPLSPILYTSAYNYMGITYSRNGATTIEGAALAPLTFKYCGSVYVPVYLVAGIILAALGCFIYLKKQNETVSDFICVPAVKPVYKFGMSFFIGLFAATVCGEAVATSLYGTYATKVVLIFVMLVIIECVVYFVMEMLIEKDLRVFNIKRFKQYACFAAVSLVIVTALKLDVFGVEDKVPDAADVKWAAVEVNNQLLFEEPSEIEKLIEAHEMILANKDEIQPMEYEYSTINMTAVTIKYRLNNGKTINRRYVMQDERAKKNSQDYRNCANYLLSVVNKPETIKRSIIGTTYDTAKVINFNFELIKMKEDGSGSHDYITPIPSSDSMSMEVYGEKFYKALLKDIDENGLGQQHLYIKQDDERIANPAYLNLYSPKGAKTGNNLFYGYYWRDNNYMDTYGLEINFDCKNAIGALIEMGFIESEDDLITYAEMYKQ